MTHSKNSEKQLEKPDFLRQLVQTYLQEYLEQEVACHLGALPYECTQNRRGHRNGYKPRQRQGCVSAAPRAPGERQTPAAGLYSGAMMMLSPYRPATASTTGFGVEIFFNRAIYASRRGKTSKCGILVGFCLFLHRHP